MKNNSLILSIVVPVYNVEDYLSACLDSIFSEMSTVPASQCELVVVDDGSTDRSGNIAKQFAQSYPQIALKQQKNTGLGGARNTGIGIAKGEYIWFVDSDDTIIEGSLKKILSSLKTKRPDGLFVGLRSVNEQGEIISVQPAAPKHSIVNDNMTDSLAVIISAPTACTKIFKRSLYLTSGIRFPSRLWYEDLATMPRMTVSSSKIVISDIIAYSYLIREGSIMHNGNIRRNLEVIEAIGLVKSWFIDTKNMMRYREVYEAICIHHVRIAALIRVASIDRRSKYIDKLLIASNDASPGSLSPLRNKYLSSKDRLLVTLINVGLIGVVLKLIYVKNLLEKAKR